MLPKRGISYAMRASSLEAGVRTEPGVETSMMELYNELLSNAINFAVSNAKRRKVRRPRI